MATTPTQEPPGTSAPEFITLAELTALMRLKQTTSLITMKAAGRILDPINPGRRPLLWNREEAVAWMMAGQPDAKVWRKDRPRKFRRPE